MHVLINSKKHTPFFFFFCWVIPNLCALDTSSYLLSVEIGMASSPILVMGKHGGKGKEEGHGCKSHKNFGERWCLGNSRGLIVVSD